MTRHQLIKKENTLDRKCKTAIFLSVALFLALTVLKMVFSNRASTWGHSLDNIKQQTFKVKQANSRLESDLAQKTGGLSQLSESAKKQGFINNPEVKYFAPPREVAQILP